MELTLKKTHPVDAKGTSSFVNNIIDEVSDGTRSTGNLTELMVVFRLAPVADTPGAAAVELWG